MASLESKVSRLEECRLQAAIDLIFAAARGSSLEGMALFITGGFELEQKPDPDEAEERRLWALLGIPLEAVRVAEAAPGRRWAVALGDMLFDKRGLRDYMRRHYPKTVARLYGQRLAER